jgi:hypothetical protein
MAWHRDSLDLAAKKLSSENRTFVSRREDSYSIGCIAVHPEQTSTAFFHIRHNDSPISSYVY